MRKLVLAFAFALLGTSVLAASRPEATWDRPAASSSTAKPSTPSGRPSSSSASHPSATPHLGTPESSASRQPLARPAAPTPPVSSPPSRGYSPSSEPQYSPSRTSPVTPSSHPPQTTPSTEPQTGPSREPTYAPTGEPQYGPSRESPYAPSHEPGVDAAREPVVAPTGRAMQPTSKPGLVTTPTLTEPVSPTRMRPFEGAKDHGGQPPSGQEPPDHRFDGPAPGHEVVHPDAHHPPPDAWYYQPCYAHWWVHPYYRWMTATYLVVDFPFLAWPWDYMWYPPARYGWVWAPGYWYGSYWYPGYWAPYGPPPMMYGVSYVYVPGFWWGTYYYEGYYRVATRPGWVWMDTYYVDETPAAGHWEPEEEPPIEGYVWEPGFWNGDTWVEGFWRPDARVGYRWVSAAWDQYGVHHAGYWEPIEAIPGQVWVPGWFDGVKWIPGYWVPEEEYRAADPQAWTPEPGWDAGRTNEGAATQPHPVEEGAPLAIPVE